MYQGKMFNLAHHSECLGGPDWWAVSGKGLVLLQLTVEMWGGQGGQNTGPGMTVSSLQSNTNNPFAGTAFPSPDILLGATP